MPVFSPGLLKRTELISLLAKRNGGSMLLAATPKTLPWGGTEATGLRDYSPGDDFKAIDWPRFARRNELCVRLFGGGPAERDVHILLDASPSMGLGSPAKFHLARQIATALGYAVLLDRDRLLAAAFANGLTDSLSPLRHASRIARFLKFLEGLSPCSNGTNLLRAVKSLVARGQRSGPIVLISDLYDPDGFEPAFNLLQFHGYDPRLVHLVDPDDSQPDVLGDVEIIDVESHDVAGVTVTQRTVRRYRELVAEFHESVRAYCERRGIPYLKIACDTPEQDVLPQVLACRGDSRMGFSPSIIDSTLGFSPPDNEEAG